ncbi:MAG: energy transducer TonB [Deltaproteobacteria bacterium]
MTDGVAFADRAPPRPPAFPLGSSLAVSLVLHAGLVFAILASSIFRPPPLQESQAIHVKLARIGTPRDKKLLPRKPVQPISTPAAPVPVATSKAVPIASTHPSPKLTNVKAKSAEDRLRSALSKLQDQVDDQSGQADGFENGTDDATEGDLYWARVVDRIRRFYVVPNTIPEADRKRLVADVQVAIGPDGTLLDIHTQSGSGNATFDHAIEEAVKRCRAVPPPPVTLARQARSGVVLEFRSAEM